MAPSTLCGLAVACTLVATLALSACGAEADGSASGTLTGGPSSASTAEQSTEAVDAGGTELTAPLGEILSVPADGGAYELAAQRGATPLSFVVTIRNATTSDADLTDVQFTGYEGPTTVGTDTSSAVLAAGDSAALLVELEAVGDSADAEPIELNVLLAPELASATWQLPDFAAEAPADSGADTSGVVVHELGGFGVTPPRLYLAESVPGEDPKILHVYFDGSRYEGDDSSMAPVDDLLPRDFTRSTSTPQQQFANALRLAREDDPSCALPDGATTTGEAMGGWTVDYAVYSCAGAPDDVVNFTATGPDGALLAGGGPVDSGRSTWKDVVAATFVGDVTG